MSTEPSLLMAKGLFTPTNFEDLRHKIGVIADEIKEIVVGQDNVIEQLLIAVLSGEHALLMGVPGLAKTLTVETLAKTIGLSFKRIQFTPDLMPSDITGTEVIQEDPESRKRRFKFMKGPIFANVVLADEINRTPPKTQAALLEAMQERQVSVAGKSHRLPEPFFVLATQNPIEQEGTYPLPEAQLDRFLFLIKVDYPSDEAEKRIVRLASATQRLSGKISSNLDIKGCQDLVCSVAVSDAIVEYAQAIARMSRPTHQDSPPFVKNSLTWGAGPRASIGLVRAARARAALKGNAHVATEDVDALAPLILRHRLIFKYQAAGEGITPDSLVEKLLKYAKQILHPSTSSP